MNDSYAAGVREIEALRARLARLEEIARQPRPGIGDALSDHYSPLRPPPDPRRKALESAARGFVPDPQAEAALVARAKDPAAYEAQLRAMGASPLELSLYARQREAALAVGAFTPDTTEGDAS